MMKKMPIFAYQNKSKQNSHPAKPLPTLRHDDAGFFAL
jgi:hypothetical protein